MTISDHIGVIPTWTAADRLVKARQIAGLTQVDIARLLGISTKSVKRYEAGGRQRRGLLLGWASVCGVDPAWLEFGPEGPPTSILGPPTERYRHSNAGWYVDGKRAPYLYVAMAA